MIFESITSGDQMILESWMCSTEGGVIKVEEQAPERDFCLCDFECKYSELAFVDVGSPEDNYKNDYRKFIVSPKSEEAVVNFFVIDSNGVEYAFDSTYGEVFEKGFNEKQPLMVGIKVVWVKVFEDLGYGDYTIKYTLEEFGTTVENESHTFTVAPFNTNRASDTVKIEVISQGITMNGNNYDGLGDFVNMVRLRGRLYLSDPEIEKEQSISAQRDIVDNQRKKLDTYVLNLDSVSSNIGDSIMNEGVIFTWRITDYDIYNYKDFREVELEITSVSMPDTKNYSKRDFEISLRDVEQKVNRPFV